MGSRPMKVILEKESVELNKDGSQTSVRTLKKGEVNDIKLLSDEKFLLELHNYNPDVFEIAWSKSSIFEVQLKGGEVDTLYSSKVTVKKRKGNELNLDDLIKSFSNLDREFTTTKNVKKTDGKGDNLLEFPLCDAHMGKYGCVEETGSKFNLNICEARILKAVEDLIFASSHKSIEKVLFVFGNDYFHFDNAIKTTLSGTPQDTNVQYKEMYLRGIEVLVKVITRLSEIAPVDVLMVPGNHDKTTCFQALLYLMAFYRNDKDVNVLEDFSDRKYYRYGKSLIGFTHGSEEGKNIETLMQEEKGKDWGATNWHEFHLGHLHTESVKTVNGIILRRIPSLTGLDNWHSVKGYKPGMERSQAFIWNKNIGQTDIINLIV